MPSYKVITTLTWSFESDRNHGESLALAKKQLEQILNTKPQGKDYEGFTVQVDLAKMKDRKKLIHLGVFNLEDVLPYATEHDSKREYKVGEYVYEVRMNSDRYHVFKQNSRCVACGLQGSRMILDRNPGDHNPHFNMYAEEDGRLVLMTKDHIIPKSKGGRDVHENYRCMCMVCNNLRGSYDLTLEEIQDLRRVYGNADKLPRKELRVKINKLRENYGKEAQQEAI